MRRGFKKWAETEAERCRTKLGGPPTGRLNPRDLLRLFGAHVLTPGELTGLSAADRRQLREIDPTAWSAVTVPAGAGHLVILNDAHSEARQESNLHHEAAHLVCGHQPTELKTVGQFALRVFDDTAEEEATWLGGCLHLPRIALLRAAASGHDDAAIGQTYVASPEMVRWRCSITAVDRQIRHQT
jgi:hypothetical protein